jgi:hypothetical protein
MVKLNRKITLTKEKNKRIRLKLTKKKQYIINSKETGTGCEASPIEECDFSISIAKINLLLRGRTSPTFPFLPSK